MNLHPPKEHNQQLLAFIRKHQPVSGFQLFSAFDGAGECEVTFRKRLAYLSQRGWLITTGGKTCALWSVNPDQLPVSEASAVKKPCAPKAPESGLQVVPPRQYDYLHGPAYTWSPPAPARVGATDFERLPSHGTRC